MVLVSLHDSIKMRCANLADETSNTIIFHFYALRRQIPLVSLPSLLMKNELIKPTAILTAVYLRLCSLALSTYRNNHSIS